MEGSATAWQADYTHQNYQAGRRATQLVYGVEPDLTREGGSIPITIILQVSLLASEICKVLRIPFKTPNGLEYVEGKKLPKSYLFIK